MKLIKINNNHYVVVDNSEIKEGDWVKHSELDLIVQASQSNINMGIHRKSKKITHSTQPLEYFFTDPKNSSKVFRFDKVKYISLQEVKELIGEVDLEKQIDETLDETLEKFGYDVTGDKTADFVDGYVRGYEKAIEDNKEKKYTEDDLAEVILRTIDACNKAQKDSYGELEIDEEAIIQSLQPKTEWEVEIVDGKLKLK